MDVNVHAFIIVQQAVNEEPVADKSKRHASRLGGLIGGRARAQKIPPERRIEIARKASEARWKGKTPSLRKEE